MKPCAYKKQSLELHTKGVVEIALMFATDHYTSICRKRLQKVSVDFTEERIREGVILSAILHDLGKGALYYQQQFTDRCDSSKDVPSFYLHEISSAVVAKRVCDYNDFDVPFSFFVVSSVLQHLHAMRGIDSDRTIKDAIIKFATNPELGIFGEYSSTLSSMVSSICGSYNIGIRINEVLFKNIQYDDVKRLFAWIKEIIQNRNNARWIKLYILFLNPLIVGDNIDAKRSRGQSQESINRRSFMEELALTIGE